MSKHGYTVEHGWFSGVCTGQHFAPLQRDRSQLDAIIAQVKADCVALREHAAKLEAGTVSPKEAKSGKRVQVEKADAWGRPRMQWADEYVLFAQAPSHYQDESRRAAVWQAIRRAEIGESFAADMLALADKVHGTELHEVAKAAGPEPIKAGEKRRNEKGSVLVCARVEGARVYWRREGQEGSACYWTGVQSWRKLEKAD
jgi:hypothetical protein